MAEMSGQEIYDNFQQGVGPEGLTHGADKVNKVMPRHFERAAQLQRLLAEMGSYWQGDAATGAERGANPMLAAHSEAMEKFRIGQDLINRQAGSFHEAKNKVVPVPEAPAEVQPWPLAASGEYATYRQQLSQHNQAVQHNVDVMNGYTGASTYNTDKLPTGFDTLAADNSGMSVAEPVDTTDSDSFDDSGGGGGSGPRGSAPVPGPMPGPGPGGGIPAEPGPATPPGTRPPSDSTQGVAPETTTPETTTPGAHTPTPGAAAGTPLPAAEPGRPAPTGGFGPGVGVGFPVGGGGESGGSPRGGPIGGPVPRGGVGVGAEPHGQSPRAASPVGPAAGRGPGTAMGGVPMGAGRGRDEDTERKTPRYLEAGDPDDLYGTDVLTAPPVIGEEDEDA